MNTKSFQTVCQAFVLCLAILLPACRPTTLLEPSSQPTSTQVAATSTSAATPTAGVVTRTVTLADFGPQISFTFPDALAGQVDATSLPSVPVDPQG